MATRTSKVTTAKKPAANKVAVATFPDPPDKAKADALAAFALRPTVNAAVVLAEYTKPFGEQDIGALAHTLSEQVKEVWAGDTKRTEAMLYAQANALQAIFMNLARRATNQDYLKQWEAYLRMAFKAQNQCRMTLETLATIKDPPVVFARQANINNGGQQQVNNGAPPIDSRAPVANSVLAPIELLEVSDGQRLDTGAACTTSGADPHMETVGKVNRPAKR